MYSPAIKKASERAFSGDISEMSTDVTIEVSDGRSFHKHAKIGVVRNRDGDISRAVIVLNAAANQEHLPKTLEE